MVELFFLVEVLVRPFLESEKFFLSRKIITSDANGFSVCRRIHDGIRVFLVKYINAVSINHFGSSDFSEI